MRHVLNKIVHNCSPFLILDSVMIFIPALILLLFQLGIGRKMAMKCLIGWIKESRYVSVFQIIFFYDFKSILIYFRMVEINHAPRIRKVLFLESSWTSLMIIHTARMRKTRTKILLLPREGGLFSCLMNYFFSLPSPWMIEIVWL